ncbi:alpha/beta hydrolase [Luteimonas sp. BDR2-5]|uniref:alpha/beta fold hydrolase n=1 Tax=Proluteimonas luteida TaxID=2878685 RepID=UPI001E481CB1|nr:alpha/beta hydrolase [Luteimonas sp. BDR2-5]MCD9028647.1 alpha/beta hydrolase [Luteimonas sp. BDR2-5]
MRLPPIPSLLLMLLAGLAAAGASAAAPAPPADADPYAEARAIIANLQRVVAPGGVQEQRTVRIGGIDQWISVRGNDRDNPILLYLHGGPASPMMPASWTFQRPWEDYFTVVQWDQRAAGRTYRANDPDAVAPTIAIDRYVADTIELIDHLRTAYGKRKVVLVGHSWGTVLGMRVLVERPDLLHAYVGIGQVMHPQADEAIGYRYALDRARAEGNREAIAELEALAPYPGDDLRNGRIDAQRKWVIHYGGHSAYRDSSDYFFRAQRLSPDYDADDRRAIAAGSALTLDRIFGEWPTVDFTGIRRVEAPVVMLIGRHDYTTPSQPVADWLATVEAPYKHGAWFEQSAHFAPIEEPGRTLMTLVRRVRPLAVDAGDGAALED